MSTLAIVLITVGATFLILTIIGALVNDEENTQEIHVLNDNELVTFVNEQRLIFEQLEKNRPSTLRNSLLMKILHILTLVLTTLGIGLLIYVGYVGADLKEENITHHEVMTTLIILTMIPFLFGWLAKMVLKRNNYIDSLEELLRSEPKHVKKP